MVIYGTLLNLKIFGNCFRNITQLNRYIFYNGPIGYFVIDGLSSDRTL